MHIHSSLIGYETKPEQHWIKEQDVIQFAIATGTPISVFKNIGTAHKSGHNLFIVPPTFVTRFRGHFDCMDQLYDEIELKSSNSFILHADQSYMFTQPIYTKTLIRSRWRISSIQKLPPPKRLAIVTLEQIIDDFQGQRLITGQSSLIFQEIGNDNYSISKEPIEAPHSQTAQFPQGNNTQVKTQITQEMINNYAIVSNDDNPIHVDKAAAKIAGLSGTVAHGMLSMAILGQLAYQWLKEQKREGAYINHLHTSFHGLVFPSDILEASMTQTKQLDEKREQLKMHIANQTGKVLTSGWAEIDFITDKSKTSFVAQPLKEKNEPEDKTVYQVVTNQLGQYALWPIKQPDVPGWTACQVQGSKEICLNYIAQTWPAMKDPRIQKQFAQANQKSRGDT